MKDRLLNWTKVKEKVGETFLWGLAIFEIVNINPLNGEWIICNMMTGREILVR